ncbi:hypothetical protein [Streptomyces sp. CA-132043]|uniref:hypothetical protein n=1 Tax=Streptomyces sp. CA-132043 TaxID=3240048 RepID=UPI003D929DF6
MSYEQRLDRVDLGEVPYAEAMEAMRGWVEERRAGRARDRLFLLTHPLSSPTAPGPRRRSCRAPTPRSRWSRSTGAARRRTTAPAS